MFKNSIKKTKFSCRTLSGFLAAFFLMFLALSLAACGSTNSVSLNLSDFAIIQLSDGTTIKSGSLATLHIGDTFSVVEELSGGYTFCSAEVSGAEQSGVEYVVTGDVSVTVSASRFFVDYAFQNSRKISAFADENGNTYAVFATEDDFAFCKYVGTTAVSLSGVYEGEATDAEISQTFEELYLASLSGEKISILGDSITWGYGATWTDEDGNVYTIRESPKAYNYRYSTVLANIMGMTEANFGKNGGVYCQNNERNLPAQIDSIQYISDDTKIVVVNLGINDFNNATESWATIGQFGSTDVTTIFGAVDAFCAELSEHVAGKDVQVFICTSMPTLEDITSGGTLVCGAEYTMQELANAISAVAEAYDFGIVDLYGGIDWTADLMFDNLHPNNDGCATMAEYIKSTILESCMFDYVLSMFGY